LLLGESVLKRIWILRKLLAQLNPVDAAEFVMDKMKETETNSEFLEMMNS